MNLKQMNYYNEIDPFAAKWLRSLIEHGLIPDGHVDERSIADVRPEDLDGYTQCHFFAVIGGWPRALELASWPSNRPVWTGSCPCQPLSCAGKGEGEKDERHLWPVFYNFIRECRPPTIFGEQVASKLGLEWVAGVHADLENEDYRFGAADLPAACVGAPHIRSRLFWVAHSNNERQQAVMRGVPKKAQQSGCGYDEHVGGVAESMHTERRPVDEHRKNGRNRQDGGREKTCGESGTCGEIRGVADTMPTGRTQRRTESGDGQTSGSGGANFWSNSVPIPCSDGKWRRVPGGVGFSNSTRPQPWREASEAARHRDTFEPTGSGIGQQHLEIESGFQFVFDGISAFLGNGWHKGLALGEGEIQRIQEGAARITEGMTTMFPLCGTVPGRTGLLKGAGNAIVPQAAAEFIKAFMGCR